MADKSAPQKYMRTKFELWIVHCSWMIGGNCCCTPLIEWRPAPAQSWSPPSLIVLPPTNNNPNQLTFLKLTLTFASEREFQRVSWVSVKATYRGGICPCRHCRRQCKSFARGVNFSIFTHFLCFFPTKTVEIRWNWRCKIFSLKIRRCKFLDKFHVWKAATVFFGKLF